VSIRPCRAENCQQPIDRKSSSQARGGKSQEHTGRRLEWFWFLGFRDFGTRQLCFHQPETSPAPFQGFAVGSGDRLVRCCCSAEQCSNLWARRRCWPAHNCSSTPFLLIPALFAFPFFICLSERDDSLTWISFSSAVWPAGHSGLQIGVSSDSTISDAPQVRVMHDFHIKEHNLAEMLRLDPGGFIVAWPPEDKPKGLAGPSPKPEKTKYLAYWIEYSNSTMLLTRFSRAAFYDSHMMARDHVGPYPPHVPSTGWNAFYGMLHFCQ